MRCLSEETKPLSGIPSNLKDRRPIIAVGAQTAVGRVAQGKGEAGLDVLCCVQIFPLLVLGKKDSEALVGVGMLVGKHAINQNNQSNGGEVGLRV